MDDIKPGDVVKLKSGGPEMTVTGEKDQFGFQDKNAINCQWFADDKLKSAWFQKACLAHVKKKSP